LTTPAEGAFSGQPPCRITFSHASDNYYYDEQKKASEKFAVARNGSLFAALLVAMGDASAAKFVR
jgi:hypothetical protein